MGLLLALVLLVVPIAELYVIVQVAHGVGILNTLALLVVVSLVGAWLVKREGLAVLRRFQEQVDQARVPAREIVDGFLVLLAGALLMTPGFLTDVIAILLLFPPTRAAVRGVLVMRFRGRVQAYGIDLGSSRPRRPGPDDVIDV